MKNLDLIAEELFNKIRGRFPSVTIGNGEGKVTNKPTEARFYDFDYVESEKALGKVSISLTDDAVEVMYSNDFVANEDILTRENWYNFLKELRQFSKKRMLKFDTRNINKSNLDQRDYKFLATNRTGDDTMNESKMYGTSKTSYQNVGEARIAIKHSKPVNTESATGRIQNISAIFIESPEGERFKYPFKHLNGARAMARHVAEGGKPFDDFGQHITGLSEELNSLKKFKSYVGRSSVMAEGLSGYMLPVNERLEEIKKTISSLQKESTYRTAFESFEQPVFEDVPEDVAENWIDQLTIKQFNEELKDVFPFVYRLVSEATKAKIVSAADLLGEAPVDDVQVSGPAETYTVQQGDTLYSIAQKFQDANFQGADINDAVEEIMQLNNITNPRELKVGMELQMPYFMGSGPDGATRGLPPGGFQKYESELEGAFEEMMGQFGESDDEETDEGNKFTAALAKAKANDDDEMEVDGKKIPVTEFILSMYDRETGQFPKGETAVLTAVEKDYGEQFINPAKQFIEAINAKFEEINGYRDPDLTENPQQDLNREILGFMRYVMQQDRQLGYRASDLARQHPGQPKMALQALQSDGELAKMWQEYSNMNRTYTPGMNQTGTGQDDGDSTGSGIGSNSRGGSYVSPEVQEGGPITHAIASSEMGDKIAKAIDNRPTKGLSAQNIAKKVQSWFDKDDDEDDEVDETEELRRLSGLKEYDDDEYINSNEFPKIRTDIKKSINGYPHIAIEYYNGDMWLLPQATNGKPVFTNKRAEYDELLRRQLTAKGIGLPEKYNGDYTKRDGKWMSGEDAFDYESKASANSPYAKAQRQNKADLAAKGIDFEAELAKAREAGKYPDPRIQDVDDFLGYLMQQHGVKDNTPSTYTISGFGVDIDDDGYTFKDTSQFIKGGIKANNTDQQPQESALQAHIGREKYGKEGMAKLAQAGREGASEEELGRIKDKYKKESEDLRRLAGL